MANPFDEKILGERQKIALAQRLRESGQDMPQGRMVGGWFVAPTWTQQLSQALKQGLGAYQESQAENKIKDVERERAQATADAFSQMGMPAPSNVLAEAGTPAQKPSIMDRIGAALTFNAQPKGTPAQPYQQTIAQNPNETQTMGGILNLAGSNPEMAAVAQAMQGRKWTREDARLKQIEDSTLRKDLQTERLDVQKQMAADRLETQRSIQAMIQANRPERQAPQGTSTIVNPANKDEMIVVDTYSGRLIGSAGAEPKSLIRQEKEQAKIDEQTKGQESFQSTLYDLKGEYDKLNSLGSMKSDQNSSIANALGVKLKTSTGQLLGTETGTAISNIEQARKSIIQDIKTATGMSAGQLNSNFELQNMLDTVTNPNSSYEAVQDQLNTMSKKFGTGEAIFPERLPASMSSPIC